MIKIHECPVVYMEYDKILGGGVESKYEKRKDVDKIQFLIRKKGEIVGAASLRDIQKNDITYKAFVANENLFYEVQEYVCDANLVEGTCFPVLSENGDFLFLLSYFEDLIAGIKRKDISDYKDRFQHLEGLDFTFLNQWRTFVFLEVEDYSIAIARLLLEHYPDKNVVFMDKRIKYFVKRVCYLPICKNAAQYMEMTEEWMRGKGDSFWKRLKAFTIWKVLGCLKGRNVCIIKADRRNHPDDSSVVYNSQNIIYSLLWHKTSSSYGDDNSEKTIVMLDYSCDDEGLVSIMNCAFAHVMWILDRGYIPVINLNAYPNQYLNSEEENMWEYFFEPVSEITVTDAYKSKQVISAIENDMSWCDFHINPYQRKYMKLYDYNTEFGSIIRLNEETKKHISEIIPKKILKENRVLGIVARGTDFRNEAAIKSNKTWRCNVVEINKFLEACNFYKKKFNCDYVFVATEDVEFFNKFQDYFGQELLSVSQKRVTYDYTNQEYKPVKDLLEIEDGKKAGRDYLAIIQSLAECNVLLYNVECGAVQLAWRWSQGKYELFQCIDAEWREDSDEHFKICMA